MTKICDPGDFVEIVNGKRSHTEIQRELRSALNVHMKIVRLVDKVMVRVWILGSEFSCSVVSGSVAVLCTQHQIEI